MNNYHVIGILEKGDQRQAIDQHLHAANALAAIDTFERGGWYWIMGKVTALRLPCANEFSYNRQVALARNEVAATMAKPIQTRLL